MSEQLSSVQVICIVDSSITFSAYFLTKSYSQAMFFSILIYYAKFFPLTTKILDQNFGENGKTNVHCSLFTVHFDTDSNVRQIQLTTNYYYVSLGQVST